TERNKGFCLDLLERRVRRFLTFSERERKGRDFIGRGARIKERLPPTNSPSGGSHRRSWSAPI
ncbi:hypothetical protein CCACVL1_04422, partial [Corchorus capsularis]